VCATVANRYKSQAYDHSGCPRPGVEAFVQLSEATGSRVAGADIARRIGQMHRGRLFLRMAEIAAALANREDQAAEESRFTEWAIDQLQQSPDPSHRLIGQRLAALMRPGRTILHEKGIYLMQSLALTEGADSGVPPSDAEIAILALAVNDYAADWNKVGQGLTRDEMMLADFAHFARFNRHTDLVRELVRSDLIMGSFVPRHPGLDTAESWRTFQEKVFGRTYSEQVERFLGPLALQAGLWMLPEGEPPVIVKKRWAAETRGGAPEGEAFLDTLCISADAVRSELRKLPSLDGVVRFPLPLYLTPFVEIDAGVLIGASPWLIEHQLAFGFWGKCLAEMKRSEAKYSHQTWFSVFGELFECYCRWLADQVAHEPKFRAAHNHFVASRLGGEDEIEDVVLVGGRSAALFSCKARVMVAKDVRAAASPQSLIGWFDSFFFEEAEGEHRGGAFRLLDKKIAAIRTGRHEPRIMRGARLFPVILTYDRVGESLYLTKWVRTRLQRENLLQQDGIEGPLVLDVGSFEILMSLAANGEDVFRILELCLTSQVGAATFHYVVRQHVAEHRNERLPALERAFGALRNRILGQFRSEGNP